MKLVTTQKSHIRDNLNRKLETRMESMLVKKVKSMTWDEISTILQIIGGVVLAISFIVGIAIIWTGIRANQEKDIKAKAQEERIAALDLKRIEAETILLKLQERIQPRTLREDKRKVLVETLRKSPKGRVEVSCLVGVGDACSFASELRETLLEAGRIVEHGVFQVGSILETPSGVTIRTPDINSALSVELARALNTNGVVATSTLHPMPEQLDLALFVGIKP